MSPTCMLCEGQSTCLYLTVLYHVSASSQQDHHPPAFATANSIHAHVVRSMYTCTVQCRRRPSGNRRSAPPASAAISGPACQQDFAHPHPQSRPDPSLACPFRSEFRPGVFFFLLFPSSHDPATSTPMRPSPLPRVEFNTGRHGQHIAARPIESANHNSPISNHLPTARNADRTPTEETSSSSLSQAPRPTRPVPAHPKRLRAGPARPPARTPTLRAVRPVRGPPERCPLPTRAGRPTEPT